jgi:hypothetical protein
MLLQVMGFSRAFLRRPEVGIQFRRSDFEALDAEGQSLLRYGLASFATAHSGRTMITLILIHTTTRLG